MSSPDLVWSIIRNNSSFLVKRPNNVVLNSEPLNVTNRNSFKYSSLANRKNVTVIPAAKGVELIVKNAGQTTRHRTQAISLTRDARRVARSIRQETSGKKIRGDLKRACLGRASAILRSRKVKSVKA